MGGIVLLFLWIAEKIARKQNPFTQTRLPFLLPVFVYIGWNILCYLLAPYHLEAAEEFLRFLLYGGITLLAATELKAEDISTLTKYIIAAAWISFSYAALQILNSFFPGIDPFDWRGFFTRRVFSTHANPNFFADFAVFASCIAATSYLISRRKSLLVLLGLGATALFFTESKGAWLAYAFCIAFAGWFYTNTLAGGLKKHLKKINIAVLAVLLCSMLTAGYFTTKRFQSVRFRTHTWLASLEMVKDAPIFGVGVGNFKVIYSAYKRPQIFYIESAHNVETQHAENELIEQAAVSGLPGLAIFLWLMGFVFYLSYKRLKQNALLADKRTQNLYLLGYTTALAGMFMHSWVDISIHFASSGFFFYLFMGIILALCQESQPKQNHSANEKNSTLTRILQVGLWILWLGIAALLIYQFHEVTAPVSLRTLADFVLWGISWFVLVTTIAGTGYIHLKSASQLRSVWAIFILCLVPPLLIGCFALFRANHYYSLGITFTQLGNIDGAITYFTKAVRNNPLQAEYRQFRANLLATSLKMEQSFAPDRGDTDTPSNDFERAVKDLQAVEKASPNHPLLYQNKGQLFYTLALRRSDEAAHAKSQPEYDWLKQDALTKMAQAKAAFERSLQADPVNEMTYAFLIQIGLLENDLQSAQYWVDRYFQGPDGVTEPDFLTPLRQNPKMQALQMQINARRAKQSFGI